MLDIVSDRACTAVLCAGLVAHVGGVLPVAVVFLLSFMVLDTMLSLAFLCWPLVSPNEFHLVDRQVWRLNWSPPAKAVNTAGVVLAVVVGLPVVALAIAVAVLAVKVLLRRPGAGAPGAGLAMSELLAVLAGAAVGLGSALVPLLNAEVYAVATAGTHPALALAVVVALACGQTAGKLALFEAARRGSGRLRPASDRAARPLVGADHRGPGVAAHRRPAGARLGACSGCRRWPRSAWRRAHPASGAGSSG